jgi:hypothetical protein
MTDKNKLWIDEEENDNYLSAATLLALLEQWKQEDKKYGTKYCEEEAIKEIIQRNINQQNTRLENQRQDNPRQDTLKSKLPPKPTYTPIQNAWRKMPVIK